jgi:hypothetical protein
MLFPFGNVGFLVQTLNIRGVTLFNVDCKCRISHCERCASAANTVSTDTGEFRKKKIAFASRLNINVFHKFRDNILLTVIITFRLL